MRTADAPAPATAKVADTVDEQVAAALPLVALGVVVLCSFLAFGLLNRRADGEDVDAGVGAQRPARARRARR
jgi:hypothetical protein